MATGLSWEYGSSPIIYKDMVIIHDIQKNSFIAAYNIKTGKLMWKTPREEIPGWSTPTVFEGKTRVELITNGTKAIRGYDPQTGRELWRLTPNSEITTPSPFVAHDLIYVTSGTGRSVPSFGSERSGITLKEEKTRPAIARSKRPYSPPGVRRSSYLFEPGVLAALQQTGERLYRATCGVACFYVFAGTPDGDGLSSEDGDVFIVNRKNTNCWRPTVGEVMIPPAFQTGWYC
jgi:outer membrane protein assembly factor BamB